MKPLALLLVEHPVGAGQCFETVLAVGVSAAVSGSRVNQGRVAVAPDIHRGTGDVGPAFAQGRQRVRRALGEGVAAEDILGEASETPVYARCSPVTSVSGSPLSRLGVPSWLLIAVEEVLRGSEDRMGGLCLRRIAYSRGVTACSS